MRAPVIYDYLVYRDYLRDWIAARRQADPAFSYARFAERGGCSKAALANVLNGQRTPRPDTLDAFARALDLDPNGRHYLGLLVELAGARDDDRRRSLLERILTERHGHVRSAESRREEDVFRFFEHWWIPAIREMASIPGFQDDAAWVAARLRPAVPVERVAAALQTLFDLGFLVRGDGGIAPSEVRFDTAPDSTLLAVARYHKEAIPELLRHLDPRDGHHQQVLGVTVALSPSQVQEARSRLTAVVNQLALLGDGVGDRRDRRVYQVCTQLLAVTAPADER